VFTPKYRKKALFGIIRKELKDVLHGLALQKECKIEEGYLMPDHVHMLISIPPKLSVSNLVGFLKGKSSIWVAQNISNKQQNFVGHRFWARGYFVNTVGANEEQIRKYVQNQEKDDQRYDQLNLFNR
jgi:putative transposase